jgi:DNA invertase Pin-like site-specific DNA recombinase
VTIIDRIEAKGATLRVLAMNLDTGSSTGRLMLNVLGSVAQFEREVMLERQREGIAKAKAEKKYKGRVPTARAKAAEVRQLAAGGMSKAKIAGRTRHQPAVGVSPPVAWCTIETVSSRSMIQPLR